MDSFILFNDNTSLPNSDKPLALEQETNASERPVANSLEIVSTAQATSTGREENPETEVTNSSSLHAPQIPNTCLGPEVSWFLEFDGAVNKLGAAAGVWIYKTHENHAQGHAYRLNFKCTNNMAEYEALLLGLKLLKTLGATAISTLGDSDLIIQQIKGNFVANDSRMRAYRATASELLSTFSDVELAKIMREHNIHAHSLATFASTCRLPFGPSHHFTAEVKHRPSIPNNVENWQVFKDDVQINKFLTLEGEFSSTNIDMDITPETQQLDRMTLTAPMAEQILSPTIFDSTNIRQLKQSRSPKATEAEEEFMDLKGNILPAGLTPLEDMFDNNDVARKPKMEPLDAAIEEYNIGTAEHPKMIKLSKNLPPDQKPKYVDLFKEFQDVFSWSYEDLKSYDTSVIQRTIPLRPNQKPFKQKIRRINPMLLPMIEK